MTYSGAGGAFGVQHGRTAAPDRVVLFVAFVPYVAKKKFGRKRHKTHKGRTCFDVYVRLADDIVTVYSGTPGGHTTKDLARHSRNQKVEHFSGCGSEERDT
jgi:hypothetical protein